MSLLRAVVSFIPWFPYLISCLIGSVSRWRPGVLLQQRMRMVISGRRRRSVLRPAAPTRMWQRVGAVGAGHDKVRQQQRRDAVNQPVALRVDALIKNACKLPQELYKSLTWDRR